MESARAGRYVMQPEGYRTYIPRPLPPEPPIAIDDQMLQLLSRADQALGRLAGSIHTLPDADLFVLMYVRKEAVLSSRIEGTRSTLDDVLEDEAQVPSTKRPADVREVRNYVDAMNKGLALLDELPLSARLLRKVHGVLLSGVRGSEKQPGELRRSQNWIGFPGSSIAQATFVPPPPHEVPQALADLERFIHSETPLPYLLKTGLVHPQFEAIHPFLDGNGRVGRLLLTLMLFERGLLAKPVLYLSAYFVRNRSRYYELLQRVHDDGAWEDWLRFYLQGIVEVAEDSAETARKILSLRERHRRLIAAEFGRSVGSGLTVLEHLFSEPITNVGKISSWSDVSFPAASRLAAKLVSAGVLTEVSGFARNRRFRYGDYVELFE